MRIKKELVIAEMHSSLSNARRDSRLVVYGVERVKLAFVKRYADITTRADLSTEHYDKKV